MIHAFVVVIGISDADANALRTRGVEMLIA
jgi:hypothetical protein